jgi:hypothetical protein
MYFEFNNNMSIKRIKSEFFNNLNVEISPRIESQEEAIEKCSNQKNLFVEGYFYLGSPKRNYSLINRFNKDIPLTFKEQIKHIIEEIKKGTYDSLKEIEVDYPVLRYTHDNLLQKILITNRKKKDYDPIPVN